MSIEIKHGVNFDRRTFFRIGSGAIAAIATYDLGNTLNKEKQLSEEAIKDLIQKGKTPPNSEALNLARQIENESGKYILRDRTPEEIRTAQVAKSQQEDLLKSAKKSYDESGKAPSAARSFGAIILAAAGLSGLIFGGKSRGEGPVQNEQK